MWQIWTIVQHDGLITSDWALQEVRCDIIGREFGRMQGERSPSHSAAAPRLSFHANWTN